MMKLAIAFVSCLTLLAANIGAQTYDCGLMTFALQPTNNNPGCGTSPSGYTFYWTYLVQVQNTYTRALTFNQALSTSGQGWCDGGGGNCPVPTSIPKATEVNGNWTFTAYVTQRPWSGATFSGLICPNATSANGIDKYVQGISCSCTCALAGSYGCPTCGGPPPCSRGYCGPVCLDDVQCDPGINPVCVGNSPVCGGNTSPIIISWDGTPVQLTDPAHGKLWTFIPGRPAVQIAWIDARSTAAFLVLDRNGNGIIDNASEMFGNYTEQPVPKSGVRKNGFNALAVFDQNQDGVIDSKDAVFGQLRLWRSDGSLHTLREYGVDSISLNYSRADYTDEFGNKAEFKSLVTTDDEALPKYAGDWWLVTAPDSIKNTCRPQK